MLTARQSSIKYKDNKKKLNQLLICIGWLDAYNVDVLPQQESKHLVQGIEKKKDFFQLHHIGIFSRLTILLIEIDERQCMYCMYECLYTLSDHV